MAVVAAGSVDVAVVAIVPTVAAIVRIAGPVPIADRAPTAVTVLTAARRAVAPIRVRRSSS